jgi:WXG100 family type VII secretion target
MADRIEANYETLEEAQKKFVALQEASGQIGQTLANAMQPFEDGAWQGEGSEAFFEEMSTAVAPAMKALGGALEKAAGTIGEVARTMREAEEDARSGMQSSPQ